MFLIKGFLSTYVCGCEFVECWSVGVVESCCVDGCREVCIVIPWGSGPGIDVGFSFESLDG